MFAVTQNTGNSDELNENSWQRASQMRWHRQSFGNVSLSQFANNLLRPGSAENSSRSRRSTVVPILGPMFMLRFWLLMIQSGINGDRERSDEHLARMTLIHVDIPSSHYVTIFFNFSRLGIARSPGGIWVDQPTRLSVEESSLLQTSDTIEWMQMSLSRSVAEGRSWSRSIPFSTHERISLVESKRIFAAPR